MNEMEFNMLLASVRTNPRALEKIFGFYFPKIVYHIAKKYGRTLAEDVAQEFFASLLARDSFEHVKYPTTWVYLNCESIAKRKISYDSRYTALQDDGFCGQDEEVVRQEMYGDLYQAICDLDETERRIIDMHYWEGYKLVEIADILNLPPNTIRQKHKRLLKKIKKLL